MGSPRGALNRAQDTLQNGVQDLRTGAEQVSRGQVGDGLMNIGIGATNTVGGGYILAAAGQPIKGETALTKEAQAAANQAEQDALDAKNAAEANRTNKITTRLNEEIKLRQRQPGRSQTLLTTGITPSGTNTQTLLTMAQQR